MISFAGKISCFFILALALAGDVNASSVQKPEGLSDAVADGMSVFRPFEVRTRKMHLVRPDLLHYPMQLDVYA